MTTNEDQERGEDALRVARGLLNGCLLAIPIWLGIISIVVIVWTFIFIVLH